MKRVAYHVFVKGIPKAQPRPRMTANGHVYNPTSASAWKAEIIAKFMTLKDKTLDEPVRLEVSFFLPRPKSKKIDKSRLNEPHVFKPDTDNLLKAVMDAITNAGVWKDDALVFSTTASKWYAQDKTGAQIIIEVGF